ncbi:MAG: hypothetical protein JO040_09620 [Gemmatimonadetes bacterium]|nr:hypothetical protein [Gemmatimonadota bacterium]
MSRSITRLRQGLLALSFVGAMGFGATQVFAEPQTDSRIPLCQSGYKLCNCLGRYSCVPNAGSCPVCELP